MLSDLDTMQHRRDTADVVAVRQPLPCGYPKRWSIGPATPNPASSSADGRDERMTRSLLRAAAARRKSRPTDDASPLCRSDRRAVVKPPSGNVYLA